MSVLKRLFTGYQNAESANIILQEAKNKTTKTQTKHNKLLFKASKHVVPGTEI